MKWIILCVGLVSTPLARADVLSAGLAVGNSQGLSVQYGPHFKRNYHISVGGHSTLFRGSLDHQVFVVPGFGYSRWAKTGFYSGLGLGGIADRNEGQTSYRARIPIGVQSRLKQLNTALFAEFVPNFGPLPKADLRRDFSGGFRTYF